MEFGRRRRADFAMVSTGVVTGWRPAARRKHKMAVLATDRVRGTQRSRRGLYWRVVPAREPIVPR
jgi:hypothetical protein